RGHRRRPGPGRPGRQAALQADRGDQDQRHHRGSHHRSRAGALQGDRRPRRSQRAAADHRHLQGQDRRRRHRLDGDRDERRRGPGRDLSGAGPALRYQGGRPQRHGRHDPWARGPPAQRQAPGKDTGAAGPGRRRAAAMTVHGAPDPSRVYIFDTTLRDGEQAPGFALNVDEKIEIAHQLARLGVDVVEAGFPISSPGDFTACQRIAREVQGPVITALARAVPQDIDAVWNAIKDAARKQIHIVLSVSDIHIEKKGLGTRQQVLEKGISAIEYARQYCDFVEYSPEDAGRADRGYLYETVEAMIEAGATVINVPDTTGYTLPHEFGGLIGDLMQHVRNVGNAIVSVHCHNDLGLAVANSLAAIDNGARRVECTINGIGERAGNASLEE